MPLTKKAPHTIPQFTSAMQKLHNLVVRMGRVVESQVGGSLEALSTGDREKAKTVIAEAKAVNRMEILADKASTRILALHNPVAGDLRRVIVMLKTVTDMERIGDEAEHIADQSMLMSSHNDPTELDKQLACLGEEVKVSLGQLLVIFDDWGKNSEKIDIQKPRALATRDRLINKQADDLIKDIIGFVWSKETDSVKTALSLIWCVRSLERIGDHIKNISQYLVYFVKGVDVRHSGSSVAHIDALND